MTARKRKTSLGEMQLDALREVANIGCGHAASALSKLMGGHRVNIEVPHARVVSFDDVAAMVGGPETPVVAVELEVRGGVQGRLMLLMPSADARALSGALLGAPVIGDRLGDEARSAVCEVANIVASAFLTATSKALNMRLVPSVPRFGEDMAGAVLDEVVGALGAGVDDAVVLETRFSAAGEAAFNGQILLMPDLTTLPELLKALGL